MMLGGLGEVGGGVEECGLGGCCAGGFEELMDEGEV